MAAAAGELTAPFPRWPPADANRRGGRRATGGAMGSTEEEQAPTEGPQPLVVSGGEVGVAEEHLCSGSSPGVQGDSSQWRGLGGRGLK